MTKYAVVFVADPNSDPPEAWKDEEYEKANRFIEGLMAWGYSEDNIFVIGDETRFYHGTHSGECRTDGSTGFEYDDKLGLVLTKIQEKTDIEQLCEWISDDCPLINDEPVFNIKQNTKDPPPTHPTVCHDRHKPDDPADPFDLPKISTHLKAMNPISCQKTVIISGKGSGNMALKLHEDLNIPDITLIASSPGDVDYDSPPGDIDHFNIGIVMPQVPPHNFKGTDGAFWAEVARLNGEQTPLMWPSQD